MKMSLAAEKVLAPNPAAPHRQWPRAYCIRYPCVEFILQSRYRVQSIVSKIDPINANAVLHSQKHTHPVLSSQYLHLFLFLAALLSTTLLFPLLPISPAPYPLIATIFPCFLRLALSLPFINLLVFFAPFPTFFLHPSFGLSPPPRLFLQKHLHGLLPPLLLKLRCLQLRGIDGPLVLADQEPARVRDALIQVRARFLFQ